MVDFFFINLLKTSYDLNVMRQKSKFSIRPSDNILYLEQVEFYFILSHRICRRNYAVKKIAESVNAHYKSNQIFLAYISSV